MPCKDYFSKEFSDLLENLLVKEPRRRLGSNLVGGIKAIKEHKFFSGIDWDRLTDKSASPPLRIKVKGPGDVSNFEKEVLDESLVQTPVPKTSL